MTIQEILKKVQDDIDAPPFSQEQIEALFKAEKEVNNWDYDEILTLAVALNYLQGTDSKEVRVLKKNYNSALKKLQKKYLKAVPTNITTS